MVRSEKKKQIDFLCLATAFILFLNLLPVIANTAEICHPSSTVSYTASSKSIDNLVGHFDNKIKIIFSDIDGTLMPLDKTAPYGKMPESIGQSIQKLKQAQIPLILVTGRSSWEAKLIAKKINNENTYIIAQQGAEINDPNGQMIYQDNINNKDFRKIFKSIKSFNKFHKQTSKFFFFIREKSYSNENTKFPYCNEDIKIFKSLNDLESNFTSSKIVLYNPNIEELKLLQLQLRKKFLNYNVVITSDCTCDVTSLTATKGNAVKKLADILGVDLKNVAVFGDSENDISMLKQVKASGGLAIAVENATNAVKENANFITSSVYENGFVKAVDKILENNVHLK